MKHDIEEVIAAAIMSHEPAIIVEGQDDIKFYSNIASKEECCVNVLAVENIEGYTEGCESVIKVIEDVQELIERDVRVSNSILGIIDRDARYYLDEIPEFDNLLVLKYYSYESHLITKKSIRRLLGIMTKANREMLTDEIIEYFQSDFESKLNELYYFSLESLKARCYDGYETCIAYGDEAGHILAYGAKEYYWSKISPKKEELDQFAIEKGLGIENVREIAKGKWYLYCWCEYIIQKSKKMYELCGSVLPQCIYCQNGVTEKCLWKQESIFQIPNVKSILYSEEIIDLEEVRYITDKIKQFCC